MALVEFALVVPVLACLLLGIVTGGAALGTKNSITNATREAARLGATLPIDSSWGTSVRDRAVSLSGGDLAASEVCARLYVVGDPTPQASEPTTCPFGGEPATPAGTSGTCVVKVWTRTTATIEAFFFTRDVALTADAIGQYERTCPPPPPASP